MHERILGFTRPRGWRNPDGGKAGGGFVSAARLLILWMAAASAYAQGGAPLPDRTPPPRWQVTQSRDGRFSFEMPGQPAYKSQTLKAKNGSPVAYATYTVDLGKAAYMVSTSDYDEKTKIDLDGAIEGVMSSWEKPREVHRKSMKLYGHPAQIVEMLSGDYHVVVRAVAVGKRLYQLGFVEEIGEYLPAHADRFMKSLRLH
jgi:hypothetical protein